MNAIDSMIDATIGKEGRYSNNPSDTGGATCWGITERVARRNGYTDDMRALPRYEAVAIYRQEYAIKPGFAAVAEIDAAVGAELFDSGVNFGPARPSAWFQRALNGLNARGTLYRDIAVDSNIGPGSLAAFKAYRAARGAEASSVMLKALNCLQGACYIELVEGRSANEDFLFGWLRTRVSL